MQEFDERVDVVALEGVGIARNQVPLVVAEGPLCGVLVRGKRRPGPQQRRVDRAGGGVDQVGDLGGRPGQHVAQDQHRPLPGRQVLQGGDEREPDRVAVGDHVTGIGRQRGQPQLLGRLGCGERRGGGGRAQVHRDGAAAPLAQQVQADVGGDAVDPRPDGGAPLEARLAPPGPDHRLLCRVIRLERRPEHPVAVADQLGPQRRDLLGHHASTLARRSDKKVAERPDGSGREGKKSRHGRATTESIRR